jgi:hypothetical protein
MSKEGGTYDFDGGLELEERGLFGEDDFGGSGDLLEFLRAEGDGFAFVLEQAVDDISDVGVLQLALRIYVF